MRTALRIIVKLDNRNTGFRFYAFKRGKALGILGSIAYYGDDQCIVIHAEGRESVLQDYISILSQGTAFSKVVGIMSAPDRLLNSGHIEILPTVFPLAGFRIEERSTIGFKIGLFGF